MKNVLILLALTVVGSIHAQVLTLSNFSNFAVGATSQSSDGPWSDATFRSDPTTFSIGNFGHGTPSGNVENGFIQWLGSGQNWSTYQFLNVTGAVGATNATQKLNFYMEDSTGDVSVTSFNLSLFTTNLGTIAIPLLFGAVDRTAVEYWGFTGGDFGAPEIAFTFDNASVAAVSAVPEPSTYAVVFSAIALISTIIRRRDRRRREINADQAS